MDFLLMSTEGRQRSSWLFEEVQFITVWSDIQSFYAFFWSQLHGRCSARLLLWDNSTFPRKVEKWSLLFPRDISSWELPGEAKPSACPAEAKSICTTNAYSLPWSGSDISLLPPTKLTLAAGSPPAFTPVQVLQPQSKIFNWNTKKTQHCCSVTQQNLSQINSYCDFRLSSWI